MTRESVRTLTETFYEYTVRARCTKYIEILLLLRSDYRQASMQYSIENNAAYIDSYILIV